MTQTTRQYALSITIWTLLAATLIGCAVIPTVQPTNEVTETPIPAASLTTSPAPSRTPSPSLTPTIAPSSTPDMPLSENGPWLVFLANDELWAMNPDGTGLTQLTRIPDRKLSRFEVNRITLANGSREIAYIASESTSQSSSHWLHILRFPGGLDKQVAALDSGTGSDEDQLELDYMPLDLAWSPDGTQLAFTGATYGPTLDVYTYTPFTNKILRLTDGSMHAWNLLWSPDGRYILHTANPWFEGSGSRLEDGVVWAVRADGTERAKNFGRGAHYKGWLSYDTLLLYTGPSILCGYELRTLNVDSTKIHSILPSKCFSDVAYDLTRNIALITFNEFPESIGIENEEIPPEGPGAYFLRNGELSFFSSDIAWVYWSTEESKFYGGDAQDQVYEITKEGDIIPIDAPTCSVPYPSPDGQYRAWARTSSQYAMSLEHDPSPPASGLWIDRPDGTRTQVDTAISETTGAEYVMWSPDSRHIFFISNRIGYVASAPDFIPISLGIEISESHWYWQFEWIP
ncbi:MAG: PD40 domain-containing protein [Anaerolineae bacterium]|nr:PD40 domain-containing protein [Anaerolineae bacterium]